MARMSYGRAMDGLAAREPEAEAIALDGPAFDDPAFDHQNGIERIARGELASRSNRLARAYAERGVGAGDLVTIALPNGIEFFVACLATWKLGATPNPISARLPEAERRAIVETANPRLLVGAEPGEFGDRATLAAGFEPAASLSDAVLPDVVPVRSRAMTSGGSTGRPKVILDATSGECDPEVPENRMTAAGVTLVPGPLYHAGPFITAWQQLMCGGRIVVLARFDPLQALELIAAERVSWVLFVPTMMQRIWRLPEADRTRIDLRSLETVMCSGAPSPVWLKRAWIGWLGPERIWEAYGGSERIGGTMINGAEWLEHPGSVGRPTGDRKIRILDHAGRELPAREIGLVYMLPPGGQGSTYSYLGASADAADGGWETLGDMGFLDEDGYLYLVDRKTDMIVTGGANVYPAEIEAAIDDHPDVRSSAVIGLPDDDLGQRVHAIVDAPTRPSEDVLRAHLRERLVSYKVPRSFEFVDEPLRDDAGKVRRSALRDDRLTAAERA